EAAERLLPWRQRLSYWSIYALAVAAGRVFVGGSLLFPGKERVLFTDVAAFSVRGIGTRLPLSLNLGGDFDVDVLTVWRRSLVIGGPSVVAYPVDGGHELWRRNTDSYVFSFATRGSTLYIGGNFDR